MNPATIKTSRDLGSFYYVEECSQVMSSLAIWASRDLLHGGHSTRQYSRLKVISQLLYQSFNSVCRYNMTIPIHAKLSPQGLTAIDLIIRGASKKGQVPTLLHLEVVETRSDEAQVEQDPPPYFLCCQEEVSLVASGVRGDLAIICSLPPTPSSTWWTGSMGGTWTSTSPLTGKV